MKPFNQPLTPKESRIQALLEVFWTANTELLFLDAEFLELSCSDINITGDILHRLKDILIRDFKAIEVFLLFRTLTQSSLS